MHSILRTGALLMPFLILAGCSDDKPTSAAVQEEQSGAQYLSDGPVTIPSFDPASAFSKIEKQLSFGPRHPGSTGHTACRDWMASTLESYGATVTIQSFKAKKHDGSAFDASNVIGRFNPDATVRVLLSAHWDTRAVGDYDPDASKKQQPIPGADDGGSGVAVLLEIARLLQANPVKFGVDIVLFDAEDQGLDSGRNPLSWCQGAQHWARTPHVKNYKAEFGIHLDMVGSRDARFAREGYSRQYATQILDKVWKLAQGMGYGSHFVNDMEGPVTDDHKFVNEIARIPTINIINKPLGSQTGFGHYWHTHADDIEVIDQRTLKAVGQVVTAVLYNKYMGRF